MTQVAFPSGSDEQAPWLMGLGPDFEQDLRQLCVPRPAIQAWYRARCQDVLKRPTAEGGPHFRLWQSEVLPLPVLVREASAEFGLTADPRLGAAVFDPESEAPPYILVREHFIDQDPAAIPVLEHEAIHIHLGLARPRRHLLPETPSGVARLFSYYALQELTARYMTHQNTVARNWTRLPGGPTDPMEVMPFYLRVASAQAIGIVLTNLAPGKAEDKVLKAFLSNPAWIRHGFKGLRFPEAHLPTLTRLIWETLPGSIAHALANLGRPLGTPVALTPERSRMLKGVARRADPWIPTGTGIDAWESVAVVISLRPFDYHKVICYKVIVLGLAPTRIEKALTGTYDGAIASGQTQKS